MSKITEDIKKIEEDAKKDKRTAKEMFEDAEESGIGWRKILENPKLMQLLIKELDKKIIGEADTKQFLLLSFANIWVGNSKKRPHILVKSGSSAGKSYLVKKVLELFPENMWPISWERF